MRASSRGRAGSWRERDRRRIEARPPSITHVVRRTLDALEWARRGESFLLGVSAAFFVGAAALLSGVERSDRSLFAVSGLAFLATSCAWRMEHRHQEKATARALDKRLRHQGALFTAYELEQRESELGALEGLVRGHVLDRLRSREAVRALLPSLLLPVAAPVFAAGTLLLTLEGNRRGEQKNADLGRLSEAMVRSVGGLGEEALEAREKGLMDPRDAEELLGSWNRMRELERSLDRGLEPGSEEARNALSTVDELGDGLSRLSSALAGSPELPDLKDRVDGARNYLEALRSVLTESAGFEGPPDPPTEGPGSAPSVTLSTNSSSKATPGDSRGTMSGSPSSSPGPEEGGAPPTQGPALDPVGENESSLAEEEFLGASSLWPAAYDELISLWVDAQRRALRNGETTKTPP